MKMKNPIKNLNYEQKGVLWVTLIMLLGTIALMFSGCSDNPIEPTTQGADRATTIITFADGKVYQYTEDTDNASAEPNYTAVISIYRVNGNDTTFYSNQTRLIVPEWLFYPNGIEFFVSTTPLPLQEYTIKIQSSWNLLRRGRQMRVSIFDPPTGKDDFLYSLNLNAPGSHTYIGNHTRYGGDVLRFLGTNSPSSVEE